MRKLSANLIYTSAGKILHNGIIVIDDDGFITDVIDTEGKLRESGGIEFYNGVIVPGFINTHCHLELSNLEGRIPQKTGLTGFVSQIASVRQTSGPAETPAKNADIQMQKNGIVAVGDISNTTETFAIKQNSPVQYHTFVELFKSSAFTKSEIFEYGKALHTRLSDFDLTGTLAPHASYSVPPGLFTEITDYNSDNAVISIHNQETKSENELFTNQSGKLKGYLESRGFDYSDFNFQGRSSLQTVLPYLNSQNNILLIHNTFTDEKDIEFAETYSKNIYWTFCPSANLYIENKLPDISVFFDKGVKTCIGTDSLASNTRLSVFDELKTISEHFPTVSFEKLIESACINGAKALKFEKLLGSIETGKKPGINLITDFDFENRKLNGTSSLSVLT